MTKYTYITNNHSYYIPRLVISHNIPHASSDTPRRMFVQDDAEVQVEDEDMITGQDLTPGWYSA